MRPTTQDDYQKRILKVLVHIQSHLDSDLALDELADISHFSPFHFHRVFRGMVGESVKEHVRRLRLERGAHRLRFTGQSITDLAFEAGYETHESFTRAFRTMFGESPAEYRNAHRVVAYGASPSGVHFVAEGELDGFRLLSSGTAPSVHVEELQAMTVAFVRHVGPYKEVGAAWDRLMVWAGSKGLFRAMPTFFGVVHDDPEVTPSEKIRYDAAIRVPEDWSGEKDIGIQRLSAGKYAVTPHRGPYETIGHTYARLCGEWLPFSGRELLHSPSLEFYRNSPRDTRADDLYTDVYMPLDA